MSTQIAQTPTMIMVIKLLSDFTVKRLSGIENVPHLCVKIRHGDGYAWYGINILNITDTSPWDSETARVIQERFMEAMNKIVDLKEMITDVPRLMDSIQDITTGRRRPIMFGGSSNEKMQITAMNNIQIEVYRESVKEESQTYGGHMYELNLYGSRSNERFGVFVYHRGVILYNYADETEVAKMVIDTINEAFPELDELRLEDLQYVTQVDRQRSRVKG